MWGITREQQVLFIVVTLLASRYSRTPTLDGFLARGFRYFKGEHGRASVERAAGPRAREP